MEKEIYIPDVLSIKELAEKIGTKPADIVTELFVKGIMATLDSEILFETAKKIECKYDVLFKLIGNVTYYENRKVKIIEQGENYIVYDKEYGNVYRDKSKEFVDNLILNMLYKKPF